MVLVPEEERLDESLVGVVVELASAIGGNGHVHHVDEHAEHEGHGVGFPRGVAEEQAEGCHGEQEHGTEDEQAAAAPGVLEVLKLLFLLQVGLEGFLRRVVVLDVGQGRVVLVVGADVPDAALQRL